MRCFGLFVALVLAVAVKAQGPGMPLPFYQSFTFGMVGLASSQVARLNAVNSAVTAVSGFTCSVQLSFLDSQGTVLKTQSVHLDPQKAVFLDLDGGGITNGSNRVEIRAVVSATLSTGGPGAPPIAAPGLACSPLSTLELFDRDSGRTALLASQPTMVPLAVPAPGGGVMPRQPPGTPKPSQPPESTPRIRQ